MSRSTFVTSLGKLFHRYLRMYIMSPIWAGVRAVSCDEHRLFSVFKARQAGHRIVFEDPSDFIHVHDASGRRLQVPLRRHDGLIWLDTELCHPTVTKSASTVTAMQVS